MQYDILNHAGSFTHRGGITYSRPIQAVPNAYPTSSTLYEKMEDEGGDEILRRVSVPEPLEITYYVVCCDPDTEDVWSIYAGPFTKDIACEICDALNLAQEA